MTANRAEVNQIAQFGPETTPGTGVAATKRLDSETWEMAPNLELTMWRSQGRKLNSLSIPGKNYTDWTVNGELDYNQIVYNLSMLFGAATITTPGGGTNSRQWAWSPALTGAYTPKTFTVEKGSAERAEKTAYTFLTDLAFKLNRKENTMTGAAIGQAIQDGITLTSSLLTVVQSPVLPNSWTVYMDTTEGALGTTQQTGWIETDWAWGSAYDTFWPIKPASSFDSPTDMAPKASLKVTAMANAQGMSPLTQIEAGSSLYVSLSSTSTNFIEAAIPYSMVFDMALKCSKVGKLARADGSVYAFDYELDFVEDSGLAAACTITVVNALTALT